MFLVNTLKKSSETVKIAGKKIQFLYGKLIEVEDKQVNVVMINELKRRNIEKVDKDWQPEDAALEDVIAETVEVMDNKIEEELHNSQLIEAQEEVHDEQVPESADFQPYEGSNEQVMDCIPDVALDAIKNQEEIVDPQIKIDEEAKKMQAKKNKKAKKKLGK